MYGLRNQYVADVPPMMNEPTTTMGWFSMHAGQANTTGKSISYTQANDFLPRNAIEPFSSTPIYHH